MAIETLFVSLLCDFPYASPPLLLPPTFTALGEAFRAERRARECWRIDQDTRRLNGRPYLRLTTPPRWASSRTPLRLRWKDRWRFTRLSTATRKRRGVNQSSATNVLFSLNSAPLSIFRSQTWQVEKAYQKLALRYHPDKNQEAPIPPSASGKSRPHTR